MPAEHQSSLKQACPAGCSNLRSLPESLGALPALRQLDMGGCTSICQLPESLGDLSTLEWLDLSRCRSLTHLPDSTSRLGKYCVRMPCTGLDAPRAAVSLPSLNNSWHTSKRRPCSSVATMGGAQLSATPQQQPSCWCASRCVAATKLYTRSTLQPPHNPTQASALTPTPYILVAGSLATLVLSDCSALQALPRLKMLGYTLEWLDLFDCEALTALPADLGGLAHIYELDLSGCLALACLPESLGHMRQLLRCNIRNLSERAVYQQSWL